MSVCPRTGGDLIVPFLICESVSVFPAGPGEGEAVVAGKGQESLGEAACLGTALLDKFSLILMRAAERALLCRCKNVAPGCCGGCNLSSPEKALLPSCSTRASPRPLLTSGVKALDPAFCDPSGLGKGSGFTTLNGGGKRDGCRDLGSSCVSKYGRSQFSRLMRMRLSSIIGAACTDGIRAGVDI